VDRLPDWLFFQSLLDLRFNLRSWRGKEGKKKRTGNDVAGRTGHMLLNLLTLRGEEREDVGQNRIDRKQHPCQQQGSRRTLTYLFHFGRKGMRGRRSTRKDMKRRRGADRRRLLPRPILVHGEEKGKKGGKEMGEKTGRRRSRPTFSYLIYSPLKKRGRRGGGERGGERVPRRLFSPWHPLGNCPPAEYFHPKKGGRGGGEGWSSRHSAPFRVHQIRSSR